MTDIILKGRGHKSKSSSSFDSREKGRGETFESIQSHSEKSGTPAICKYLKKINIYTLFNI